MVYIEEVNVKRIFKDSFRFIEGNSILSKVFVCFVFVPLELHDTILTIKLRAIAFHQNQSAIALAIYKTYCFFFQKNSASYIFARFTSSLVYLMLFRLTAMNFV